MVIEIRTYKCEKCGMKFDDKTKAEEHEDKPTLNRKLEPVPGGVYEKGSYITIIKEEDKMGFDRESGQHVRNYNVALCDPSDDYNVNSSSSVLVTELQEMSQIEFDECKEILPFSIVDVPLVRGKIIEE